MAVLMTGEVLYNALHGGKIVRLMIGDQEIDKDICKNITHIQLSKGETCVKFTQLSADCSSRTEWISSDAYFLTVQYSS